ncbi:uncharacterized protein LOC131427291 [Malaya genurostris]|uniref:uncharacterized protein LOC131427291 n=1 Tax=Malaya genurostris TaxID=325434 RepID=UPI0026F3BA10|nr:uncharacterized protein LOC131427291 [Malaya genurostris]XP_058446323.1 uncharacterized protein LOC131427291 [Malaya genurostris]
MFAKVIFFAVLAIACVAGKPFVPLAYSAAPALVAAPGVAAYSAPLAAAYTASPYAAFASYPYAAGYAYSALPYTSLVI